MPETLNKDIFEMVTTEQTAYQTRGVTVAGDWEWKMFEHINYSMLMKNSQFPKTQMELGKQPYKNIIRPILNVAYRSEGFDVKDIEVYINDPEHFYKSFLTRKFHNRWARKNDLDTFIDELVETYVDYGGVLVKNVNNTKPEVVPWQSVAFCDQTDILSGTIALKHQYSVDQLMDTGDELGWYKDAIDQALLSARSEKSNSQSFNDKEKVPDKHIEVFEIHGTFPESWLSKGDESYDSKLNGNKYCKQIHIITYAKDDKNKKIGICLFKGKEEKSIFKFLCRDKIFGRALGFGGVEELFEPQIWTNFDLIHMTQMLQAASKIIHQTADTGFTTRNNVKNVKQNDIWVYEEGKPLTQVNTQPVNWQLFDKATQEWEIHARTTGSANDAQLGLNPTSGTPFALQNLITSTGQGLHQYRRGKISTFMVEIYRDWILEYLVAEMSKGDQWVDELTVEEMQSLSQTVMTNVMNDHIKKVILSGQLITQEQLTQFQQQFKQDFAKSNKKFLEVLKGEFAELPLEVDVNIAGKQKDLQGMTEKLNNVFRTVVSNPRVLQIPYVAKLFNQILESSGLQQMDFDMHGQAFPPIGSTIRETINFKDLPPEGQVEMAGMLGIDIKPQQSVPSPIQPGQLTNNPITK